MEDIISKELFCEVMEYPNDFDVFEYDPEIGLIYRVSTWLHGEEIIDILELAHECKKWALKHVEQLVWDNYDEMIYINTYGLGISAEGGFTYDEKIKAKTEHEAIFKACQYILENKDK